MHAHSILMNWKQLRRTENNVHRSTVPYVEARTNLDKVCHGFRSNRRRECARRGAGFSRFLQLVNGGGESQTSGKLCVLHSFYKGQLNIASLCNGRTERNWGAMLNLESGDRIELFYEDSPEATIRATVSRFLSDRDEGMGLV
jgi:hypothetical protein